MVPQFASLGLLVRGAWLLSLAAWGMDTAAAAAVHKCRAADGQTSYQEQPCPPGTEQRAPVLAPPPPYVAPPAAPLASPPQPAGRAPAEPPLRLPPPPLPALFRCERWDRQESYVTQDPTPRIYQVPLWAALPDRAVSSSGGLSTSRGGQGGGRSMMGAYTTVQDRCYRMGRAELCGYWAERFELVRGKLRTAFNDTRPGLEQEEDDLREKRGLYCGV